MTLNVEYVPLACPGPKDTSGPVMKPIPLLLLSGSAPWPRGGAHPGAYLSLTLICSGPLVGEGSPNLGEGLFLLLSGRQVMWVVNVGQLMAPFYSSPSPSF